MIGQGTNPHFIAELSETMAVLHDHQPYSGWVVLLLKGHDEQFDRLSESRQAGVMRDIGVAARAVRSVTGCRRINYECLGNVLAHVHWHIVPRFEEPRDPNPTRAIWVQPEAWLNSDAPGVDRPRLIRELKAVMGM